MLSKWGHREPRILCLSYPLTIYLVNRAVGARLLRITPS